MSLPLSGIERLSTLRKIGILRRVGRIFILLSHGANSMIAIWLRIGYSFFICISFFVFGLKKGTAVFSVPFLVYI